MRSSAQTMLMTVGFSKKPVENMMWVSSESFIGIFCELGIGAGSAAPFIAIQYGHKTILVLVNTELQLGPINTPGISVISVV